MGTKGRGIVLGAVLALSSVYAAAQSTLTGVVTRPVGEGIEVQILGDNLPKPKEIRVNGNKSYILEFDAKLIGKAQRRNVRDGGLSYWNVVWYSARPPKVRVLLQMKADAQPVLTSNERGWTVGINIPAFPAFASLDNNIVMPALQSATQILEGKAPSVPVKTLMVTTEPIPLGTTVPPLKSAAQILGEIVKPKTVDPGASKGTAATTTVGNIRTQKSAATSSSKVPPASALVEFALAGLDQTTKAAVTLAATEPKVAVRPKMATVTLDFVNAEVSQILKALALQANVNIVTSPDVKGALTVTLDKVSVEEALDFVTTMTGFRYGRVGNTYMVTSAGKFAEAMRLINKGVDEVYETRVVPIFSGAGTSIKASILRSVPPETQDGTYEIVLPSEETKVEKKATVGGAAGADGAKQGGSGDSTTVESKATSDAVDAYVVLIGSATRLATVERIVNKLDGQLCLAMGITVPKTSALMRATYQVRGGSATDLMKSIAGDKTRVGNVEISATPAASTSGQAIVLVGRENEVGSVIQTLTQLDSNEEANAEFVSYEVKYVDPRSLRESLISAVPGLRASVAPAPSGNPRVYKEGTAKTQGSETVKATGGASEQTQSGNGAAEVSVKGDKSTNAAEGLGQPFSDYEKVTVPMRLILSGSAEMIDRANSFLALVDVAPRQIALELRVMEMSREDALKLGIDWSLLTGGTVQAFRVNQGLGGTPSPPGVSGATLGFKGGGSADVTTMLDEIADKRNLIARPNLLAIDGRESEIFVGDVVRYIESIVTSQNGTTVTTGEVPVGVRLAVFPRVGGSGSITMDLRPVVSSLKGYTPVPGGGQLPQTSVRIAQSTVNIQSGETIALGGLIHEEDRKTRSGIPFLKDVPIIGMLFSRTDNRRVRTEVVMFLTARIVEPRDRKAAADPRESEKNIKPEKSGGG